MGGSSGPIMQAIHLSRRAVVGGKSRVLLDDFTFDFDAGAIYTVVGASGAGKTTLLRLLNRLDEPSSGTVFYGGVDTAGINPCQLRCRIGYLFQTPYLFEGTIRDNLRFANSSLTDKDVLELAVRVRLTPEMVDSPVDNLSVGEQQRVALARLLATQPEVMLLDEPTSALDPTATEAIERLIKEIVASDGVTALMVSHNPRQALRMAGTVLLLEGGRLAETGPCQQVINEPRTEAGQRYIAGDPK
jgi:putative ABC transport system ATP-binding protein